MITPDKTALAAGAASPAATTAAQAVPMMAELPPPPALAPAAGSSTVTSGVRRAIEKIGGCDSVGTMLKELSFQTQFWKLWESDSTTAKMQEADFLSKVVGGGQLFGWVCMRGKFLRLIHSVGIYAGDLIDVCEYDGHVIGFTGDRTDTARPTAVTLGTEVEWKEDEGVITSESSFISFFASEGNAQKLYTPTADDDKAKVAFPLLLMVPRGLMGWLSQRPRTAMAYRRKMLDILGGENADARPAELELSLAWLLWASTMDATTKKSRADLHFDQVFVEDCAALMKWTTDRVDTTLGRVEEKGEGAAVHHIYHTAAPAGPSPYGGQTQGQGSQRTLADSTEKHEISKQMKARLMGYCAHTMESQLPVVWTEMGTTSDTKDLRGTVMAAWGRSRATLGIDPSECYSFYLEDKYVKEVKSGDFAPGGAMPVWEYLMRGMVPLVCMNWTTAQSLQAADEATAYETAAHTRTTAQVLAQMRGTPRDPPKAWSCLKYMTNTFAVLIHALFSKTCPFFASLWRLRETICSMKDYKDNFTPELCAQLTFHMIKDSRFFFSVELRVEDIEKIRRGEDVTWPTSDLTNVSLQLRGLSVNALMTDDLPQQWRTKPSRQLADQGQRDAGGPREWRNTGGAGGAGTSPRRGGGRVTNHAYPNGAQNAGRGHSEVRHDEGLPQGLVGELGVLVRELKQRNPRANMRELRELGGYDLRRLPVMPRRDGCYGALLGLCNFTDRTCHFRKVPEADLSAAFLRDFAREMKPVLERTVQALGRGRTVDNVARYRGGGGSGGGQAGRR